MKSQATLLFSALFSCALFAEDAQPAPAQPAAQPAAEAPQKIDVGSKVTLDAVKAATWLQGTAPESFEPGRVYIFEAWATWCGPCVRVIPHMNELHKKYHDKGLRVYGMNVFEDGQEKVANFVKKKAEEMTYPVAYTGKGSRFDKEWMKAAGVRGIPHSFVVIDGTIVMRTHPASLNDALIEKLLQGGDTARQAIEAHSQAAAARQPSSPEGRFRIASAKGDVPTMEKILADMEKQNPQGHSITQMRIDLLFAKKQWPEIDAALVNPPTTNEQSVTAHMIASRLATGKTDTAEAPKELHAKAASIYEDRLAKLTATNPSPIEWVTLSRLHFAAGNRDAAQKSALTAVEKAKAAPQGRAKPAAFEKFSEEVHAGRMPTREQFLTWMMAPAPKP